LTIPAGKTVALVGSRWANYFKNSKLKKIYNMNAN
jgi:hypothetical protein